MIIMPVKEGENIERALKKFKRKYERTGVLRSYAAASTSPSLRSRSAWRSSTPFTWRTCTATRTSPPVFCTIYAPAIKGRGFVGKRKCRKE